MTTFPALVPSSRTFTPGEYPATAFSGYSGAQNRVRHSNVFLQAQLRLTFLGLSQAQMLSILTHFAAVLGSFEPFALPAELVSYGSLSDYVPATYRWTYAESPAVEDLPCGGHNVTLTLESVPPVAASAVGALLTIRLTLSAGSTTGTASVAGMSRSITLYLEPGAVSADDASAPGLAPGLSDQLTLSLAAGAATGTASASGATLTVTLSLVAGSTVMGGTAAGTDQTLTLSLVAGAASSSGDQVISALNPILWYDFDDVNTVTLSSSTITAISDKGSRGWNLSKSTTGPTQATWTNNQRKCCAWGAVVHSNYLRNTSATSTNLAEIYIVLDAAFGNGFPTYNGLVTGTSDPGWFVAGNLNSAYFFPGSFNAAYINGSATNNYSASILTAINSPALLRIKKLDNSAVNTDKGFQIGMDRNNPNRGWYGLIAEVVCFSSVLSDSDRADVQSWLATKWGLTLS